MEEGPEPRAVSRTGCWPLAGARIPLTLGGGCAGQSALWSVQGLWCRLPPRRVLGQCPEPGRTRVSLGASWLQDAACFLSEKG